MGGIERLFSFIRRGQSVFALFDIIKSEAYHGKGRREGTPGNYTYYYDDENAPASQGQQEVEQAAAPVLTKAEESLRLRYGDEINGYPFEQQLQMAKEVISRHEGRLASLMNELQELAPNAQVTGRVKAVESAVGKLVRKPDLYKTPNDLWDVTGARMTFSSIEEVNAAIAKIRERFKVLDENDYISSPQGFYRSYHLAIEDEGQPKELQIRTANQNTWADWYHDVYKPLTPDQEAAVTQHGPEINSYAEQMSNYFFAADQAPPDPGPPPPCPPVVAETFGCLS